MQDSPAVKAAIAASGPVIVEDQPAKKSLEDILSPLVVYIPKFGNKRYAEKLSTKSDLHLIIRIRSHRICERARARPP